MTFNYCNETRELTIGHLEGIVRAMKRIHLETQSLDHAPEWDAEKYINNATNHATKQAEWKEILDLMSHI